MTVNDSRKWITIARVFAPEHRHDSLSVHVCACPNSATIDLFAMKMAINNHSVETSSTLDSQTITILCIIVSSDKMIIFST